MRNRNVEINHNKSLYTKGLQRSGYLVIDHGIGKNVLSSQTSKKSESVGGSNSIKKTEDKLNLRYCTDAEVSRKRQKLFMQKAQFFIKMNHLKSKGQMQTTYAKINEWLEDNLNKLFNDSQLKDTFLKRKNTK